MQHRFLTALLAAVLLVFGAACGGENQEGDPLPADTAAATAEAPAEEDAEAPADTAAAVDTLAAEEGQVTVEDFGYTEAEDGTRLFSGVLRNDTDEPIDRAQIQVSLLDADNRQIGTDLIVVNDIPAGGTKEFSDPIDSELDVRAARVRSVVIL